MPKANAELARKLARLSTDCSFLVTHLIRQKNSLLDDDALEKMILILDLRSVPRHPKLKASSVGWYGSIQLPPGPNIFDPVSSDFSGSIDDKAVCFTESTLACLKAHREIFRAKYGLAFDRDFLYACGGNPCLNFREDILKNKVLRNGERYARHVYNFIPSQLVPYVNIIHESFDATHEREWRHVGDFTFKHSDCIFIFCPEKHFAAFSGIQIHGRPVLFDLEWLDRI